MSSLTDAPSVNEVVGRVLDDWTPADGDFVPAVVAAKVHAVLLETAPDVLDEWLRANSVIFLTDRIGQRLRQKRAVAAHQAKARAFGDAAVRAERGDVTAMRHFDVSYPVDDQNTWRRVGDMTGSDHLFVASRYQASGAYDLMIAAFHRAVAKKVGKKATAEVLTEEQYDALLRSVVKQAS